MVGRGLNVVSTDFKWHITHQILRNSDMATCADIVQKLRLLGIYLDLIQVHLFCLQRDAIAIKQSAKLQKRIFEGADLHEELATMPDLCEEIKMYVGNIPQRRTTKKCREPRWNKVAKEQEQYEDVEVEKEEKKMEANTKNGYVYQVLQSTKETMIKKFLRNINPDSSYTREQLVSMAETSGYKDPSAIVRAMCNSRTSFACWVFEEIGDKFKIREEIRDEWK
jgi:hypothetical protein